MTTITFKGEPPSTQHIYGLACRGRFPQRYMTAEGKATKETYQWETKVQWRSVPLNGDVAVSITFYFKNKRRRDLDNLNKLVLDAMTGIVYEDDSQIADLRLRRDYDPENPRIEIVVDLTT